MDTFLKELLASLVGVVSAFILGSKIRLYFEMRKSLKINLLWLARLFHLKQFEKALY